jgi:UDP-N-acetyl-D-mannosaminuronic acid dehydrogenase
MTAGALAARIESREARIGVVGLGYVGLAASVSLAAAGHAVTGVELRPERVAAVSGGRCPLEGDEPGLADALADVVASGRLRATTEHAALAACDVVLVCVETPIDDDHRPRHRALLAACDSVGRALAPGALVVIESTVAPGTTASVVKPLIERACGGPEGERFHLGHCPERVMPGRLLLNMRTMDRVLGACSAAGAAAMRALYGSFVEGRLDDADPLTAELVKTAENAYRDVAIAFANQLALICERAGADVWRVRELVNRSPGRNVLLPGSGVGGHCIPKDPWLLASVLGEDAGESLLAAARRLNDRMPARCGELAARLLQDHGVAPAGARLVVLGLSYLEESGDTRGSPSATLVAELEKMGCSVTVHDPFVPGFAGDVLEAARGTDCAVVMVAHRAYRGLDPAALAGVMRRALLVDTRAVFEPAALDRAGFDWRRLGVGSARQVTGRVV